MNENGGVSNAAKLLHATFRDFSMDDEAALHKELSAEIHSLARMPVEAGDRVILFASETADGQACAHAVRLYLEQSCPGIQCAVKEVPGLQVTDSRRFRTEGVVNFVRMALREIDAYGAAQCVLNPTGGFKSLVPYTVLVGMLKSVPARYIFEQSNALMTLPALPLDFARDRIEPVRELLERIERETGISLAEWHQRIPVEEREYFAPLIEETDGGQITLSAIGLMFWEEINRPSALVPYLSRPAMDGLRKISQLAGRDPAQYLRRIAADHAKLENDKHGNAGDGLFWLKPGRTTDRYLVSVENWRLLVWRIEDHDEYNKLSANQALGATARAERTSKYAPFFRMEYCD
ncbi:MAG: putative CRISPR-associated protein [Sulfurimicrobium sp.]|nr:putative CRISPR-associated protein [Sulfurimicrobium sp.]